MSISLYRIPGARVLVVAFAVLSVLLLGRLAHAGPGAQPSAKPAPDAGAWARAIAAEAASLRRAHRGAVVRIAAMDAGTGELLGHAGPIGRAHFTGSTIKSFAVAAALAAGVEPERVIDTGEGAAQAFGREFRDYRAHGAITLTQVLARSSNVGVVRLVEIVGLADIYRSVAGLLPLPARGRDDAAAAGRLAGKGTRMRTIDLVRGYAMIAAGGVVPGTGERKLPAEVAAELRRMLGVAVSAEGTGHGAAVPGREIAGKTGTALRGSERVALFFGMLAAGGRPVVLAVVVDGVQSSESGGSVAAPAFARIVTQALGSAQ
ncbi:penicillin-binding transpeptidase domain-containing protein [Haliangium ochraceum]|uniref:Penicillin-binding protein transpeptidase n=1 Tax=Haliangium ochraceum (strain DSM 14365 / JCM 11303 / SMP-2) TaxID=502025 RepID=D0LVF4_HALO1|nr:penicillin-binding transpeptidase domain-containing protein [Haliangium ochraceum]ACY17515.1 penicillin-binding protein transpeptidase [Haliangium ochraceum DSM 14365]